MITARIYSPLALEDEALLRYLKDVEELGVPGIHFIVLSSQELEVYASLGDFDSRGVMGWVRVGSPSATTLPHLQQFAELSIPVNSVWQFECAEAENNHPAPALVMWQVISAFAAFVDGWYWVVYPDKERFRLNQGTLLELGGSDFAVDATRFRAYVLEGRP